MSCLISVRVAGWSAALILAAGRLAVAGGFVHFEARHAHPIELGLDGRTLLGVNAPEGRLAVFAIAGEGRDQPLLAAEIPVGIAPVTVRARTADEVWVVNEVSDSISVVSLPARAVVATLSCPDEPADVVFAGGRAFVACARNRQILVFDAATRRRLAAVSLAGLQPRTLAVDSTGQRVFVGFLNSGNGTTVIPASLAPAPEAPWNPALGPAPATALIVDVTDPRVKYTVLDHDLAVLPVEAPEKVRYFGGIGTSIFGVAVRPGTDEVWVGNTEAHNRVRYEPRLTARFAGNRLTRVRADTGAIAVHDLSPFDDAGRPTGAGGRGGALAQPMDLVFSPDGAVVWVAAFASDRVARLAAADGSVEVRVDVRGAGEGPAHMRGPRGLAWDTATDRLYVLNKLASTVTTVDSRAARVLSEVPLGSFDPLPPAARAGRGLLYDARLSASGAAACGTCHIDADVDGLAWDLGDPAGAPTIVTGANFAVHDPTPRERAMHPMKGPMLTQTLRGLDPEKRLHWRGDRANLGEFNVTFRDLLGGELREPGEIDQLAAYLASLRHHPNPNRNADDSLPGSLGAGDATRGAKLFAAHIHHCGFCHVLPRGTDHNVDDPRNLRLSQPVQNPSLQTTYQRAFLDTRAGATNLTGFGLLHDGTGGSASLPTVHFYDLDALGGTLFDDVEAFVLSFDSGTAPVVGRGLTVTADDRGTDLAVAELALLEGQAAVSNRCDLVVRGRLRGRLAQFQFLPTPAHYESGRAGPGWGRADLLGALAPGDALTFLAVPAGMGSRFGVDRDADGHPDDDAAAPRLSVSEDGRIQASATPGWILESAADLEGTWVPRRMPSVVSPAAPGAGSREFFRLRRTW